MPSPVCNWIRSVLPAYLDGELKAPIARAVERHLEACESCQAHQRLLEDTWTLLGEVPEPPVQSGFTSRMMERLVEEKELMRFQQRLAHRGRWRAAGKAVAGLAAGLVIGFCLYSWAGLAPDLAPAEEDAARHLTFLEAVEWLDEFETIREMQDLESDSPSGEEL